MSALKCIARHPSVHPEARGLFVAAAGEEVRGVRRRGVFPLGDARSKRIKRRHGGTEYVRSVFQLLVSLSLAFPLQTLSHLQLPYVCHFLRTFLYLSHSLESGSIQEDLAFTHVLTMGDMSPRDLEVRRSLSCQIKPSSGSITHRYR